MNNQSGVSMIELVLVIIIIVLITTFSIYTGNVALEQASATEVFTEMNSIMEGVNSVNMKRSISEQDFDFDSYLGQIYDKKIEDITKGDLEAYMGISLTDAEFEMMKGSYIIFGMDRMDDYKNSNVRKYYGFDSIKHSYIVDFDNVKVDLLKSLKLSKQTVRTYGQVRALVEEGEI